MIIMCDINDDLLKEYDLFICSAGFEDRSLSVIEKISNKIVVTNSVINLYNIKEEQLLQGNKRNQIKIQRILEGISKERPVVITSNPSLSIPFGKILDKYLEKSKTALIDITSFTRLYLYTLLYSLLHHNIQVDILYSEPKNYTPNFTKGLEKIIIHPLMPGIPDQSKKTLMIMFLGWEVQRAESVLEEFDPDFLITLAEESTDPIRRDWNNLTLEKCSKLIKKSTFFFVPPLRTDIILNKLESLYQQFNLEYDICILNIGPKINCLSIANFAYKHEEVQVLYPKPYLWEKEVTIEGNPSPISIGKGRIHKFNFPVTLNQT